jgi:ankyrin repeat protein
MGNIDGGEEESNPIDALGLPESIRNNSGQINFHDSCLSNNVSFKFFKEIICELYPDDAKFMMNQADELQCLPFHHAIINADFESICFLLKKSVELKNFETMKDLINLPIINNATAVHLAVTSSSMEILQLFIDNGGDVNVPTTLGATPLHVACVCGSDQAEAGNIKMVKLLLTKENMNNKTNSHETPLYLVMAHFATEETSLRLNEEIANYLIDQEGIDLSRQPEWPQSLISLACQKGYLKVFLALLANEKDNAINFDAPGGYNCIHLAAKCNAIDIVKILLSRGIEVDLASKKKEIPLLFAINSNHFNMVKLLVESGADVNYVSNGTPLLSFACSQGKTQIASYLLQKKADPSKKDKHQNTALHLAACEGNYHELVELLLKTLNNVNDKNGRGKTALYLACDTATNEKTADVLISYGADVNAISPKGATALHVAAHRGSAALVRLLLSKGADASMYTNDGKLPIQFSVELGSKDCVALLLEHSKMDELAYLRSLANLSQKKKSHNVNITNLLLAKIEEFTTQASSMDT